MRRGDTGAPVADVVVETDGRGAPLRIRAVGGDVEVAVAGVRVRVAARLLRLVPRQGDGG